MKTYEINQVAMYMYALIIYHKWQQHISANKLNFMGLIVSATGPPATRQHIQACAYVGFLHTQSIEEERG